MGLLSDAHSPRGGARIRPRHLAIGASSLSGVAAVVATLLIVLGQTAPAAPTGQALGIVSLAPGAGSQSTTVQVQPDAATVAAAAPAAHPTASPTAPPPLPAGWSALTTLTNVEGSSTLSSSLAQQLSLAVWSAQGPVASTALNAVDAVDATHVWAAGASCGLWFSAGTGTWTKDTHVPVACGVNLLGVSVSDAGHGWAVGLGTILVCTAQCTQATATWQALSGAILSGQGATTFTSVWGSGDTAYVAGVTSGGNGILLACSKGCNSATAGAGPGNATWGNVTPGTAVLPTGTRLNGVSGPTPVIAVGAAGTVLVCTGNCATSGGWSRLAGGAGSVPPSSLSLASVSSLDGNGVYATGGGAIWACSANCASASAGVGKGKALWVNVTPPGLGSTTLVSIAAAGGGNVWAAGSAGGGGALWFCPSLCNLDATSWVSLGRSGMPPGQLAAVSAADGTHVWAVGSGGVIVAATTNPPALKHLDSGIGDLGTAIFPALWTGTDGNHVDPTLGVAVFVQAQSAMDEILAIQKSPPAWVTADANDIVAALRLIAATAIADNSCSPSKANELANANKELSDGDTAYDNGQLDVAINHYQNAWSHALKAQGSPCSTGGITVNPPGPLFVVTGLVPGDQRSATVTLQNTGSVGSVTVSETGVSSTTCAANSLGCTGGAGTATNMAHELLLTITDVTNVTHVTVYSGALDALPTTTICGSQGGCAWAVNEQRNLSLTVSLPSTAGNAYQGTGAAMTLVWTRS